MWKVLAIYYMVLSRRSLAHPRNKYGKGVLVATSLFAALHVANIATQVELAPSSLRIFFHPVF